MFIKNDHGCIYLCGPEEVLYGRGNCALQKKQPGSRDTLSKVQYFFVACLGVVLVRRRHAGNRWMSFWWDGKVTALAGNWFTLTGQYFWWKRFLKRGA